MSGESSAPESTQEESFFSHLIELRTRLIRAFLAIILCFIPLAFYSRELYTVLAHPLLAVLPSDGKMIATDIVGVFLVPMKISLALAFLIALPYVLYQIWAFVAPGLYRHEKRLALPLVISSMFLLIIGMAFAYFVFFPMVFAFMSRIAPEGVAWMTDIEKYFSFVVTMFIAFGVTFQVPVIVIMCVKAGVVEIKKLREVRPYIIVGSFVVGGIFTPPDIISQFMMAIPLCLLYEAGILLAQFVARPAASTEETPRAPEDSGQPPNP
ncbi:MAG: twin-arginine translocase subunit TatC [Betaproteobacteria bacterium]|nr:twin-arginine translocase subunit TatC [Betaproteobacteria bacterium]